MLTENKNFKQIIRKGIDQKICHWKLQNCESGQNWQFYLSTKQLNTVEIVINSFYETFDIAVKKTMMTS